MLNGTTTEPRESSPTYTNMCVFVGMCLRVYIYIYVCVCVCVCVVEYNIACAYVCVVV